MNLALIGYGKMGQMVEDVCRAQEDLRIAGVVDQGRLPSLRAVPSPDVAIDFSYPGNLLPLLADALELKVPLVLGTTGLSAAQEESIREAARSVAIVRAQNFSVGVTVMRRIAAEMARALGEGFDIEIVETHHRQKVDAPSGTAKMLRSAVDPQGVYAVQYGREGLVGARGREIGMHSLRGGTVAGEQACDSSASRRSWSCATGRTAGASSPWARSRPRALCGTCPPGSTTWTTYCLEDANGRIRDHPHHSESQKQTPVKAYVKAKRPLSFEGCKVFGAGDQIVFGDWKDVQPALEQNAADIEELVVENDRRNSAIPLLDLKRFNARIEPGAIIRDQVEIGDGAVIMMGAIINIGAVIGAGTMIDMGAVLGGRAIVGKRCHIGAGTVLAGVVEPPSAQPVVIEDDVVIGPTPWSSRACAWARARSSRRARSSSATWSRASWSRACRRGSSSARTSARPPRRS